MGQQLFPNSNFLVQCGKPSPDILFSRVSKSINCCYKSNRMDREWLTMAHKF